MRRLFLFLALLGVGMACAAAHKPKKPQGVLCVWPDPITFSLADDTWHVCFDVSHEVSTGYAPVCMTVKELRTLVGTRRLATLQDTPSGYPAHP